jgi:hypothetical protein
MTSKLTLVLALAAASAFGIGSANACKLAPNSPLCQVGQPNCEPLCITTSDGPGQPYTDGRNDGMVNGWQWRRIQQRRQRIAHARAAAGF